MIKIRRSDKVSLTFGYKKIELANRMFATSPRLNKEERNGKRMNNFVHSSHIS